MASFGDFLSGASGGMMAGQGLGTLLGGAAGGPIGLAIGAGLGGLAALGGPSAEDVRRQNYNELMASLDTLQAQTAERGFKAMGGQVQKNMSAARQAALRRAAAMGRSGSAESLIAPVENRAQIAGGDALTGWWNSTQDQFTRAKMGAATEFAGRPIEPSAGQYIATIGQGIGRYLQNKDYISALREYGKTSPASSSGLPPFSSPSPTNFGSNASSTGTVPFSTQGGFVKGLLDY